MFKYKKLRKVGGALRPHIIGGGGILEMILIGKPLVQVQFDDWDFIKIGFSNHLPHLVS